MRKNVNKYILFITILIFSTEVYSESLEDYEFMVSYYMEEEDYKNILLIYEKELVLYENDITIKFIDKADFYDALGFIYGKNFKYEKALKYRWKANKMFKTLLKSNDIKIARNYHNISDIYFNLSQYNKAVLYGTKAISLFEKLDNEDNIAHAYAIVGVYQYYLGNNIEALSLAKKAVSIFQERPIKNNVNIAMEYNNLAEIYKTLGNDIQAIKYYTKSIDIVQKNTFNDDNIIEVSNLYANLGEMYHNLNYEDNALKSYLKFLNIREKRLGNLNIETAYAYQRISNYYKNTSQEKKAFEYIKKALNVVETPIYREHIYTSLIYQTLSELYFKKEKYLKSIDYLQKSISIEEKIFGENHMSLAYSYKKLSDISTFFNLDEQAYTYIQKAFNISEKHRIDNFIILNSKEKELYLIQHKYFIFHLLYASFSYNKNDGKKYVFHHWLNYKASIFDSENSIASLYQNTKNQALKDKIEILTANQRTLSNLYQNIPKDQKKWQENIKLKEEEIANLNNEIAQKSSIFQEEQGLKSIDYKDITKNLKNNELYIDYAKAGDYYYVFTLDKKENIEFIQIDENRTKVIDALVMSFRDEVQSILDDKTINKAKLKKLTKSSKEKLARLYELLIKNPLKEQLKGKSSLIVSPDGALRLLPFETLYDKEKQEYLIESKEIRYIPSGKELVRLYKYAKNRVPTKENVMVFANPNFDSNETAFYHERIALTRGTNESIIKPFFQKIYKPLLGTQLEAEEINRTMDNVEIFEKNRANETNLLKVEEPKILHIATHGFFINAPNIPNPMLKSGIILSGANKSAREKQGYGRVTALKLSGLNLKSTDLVVLSACDTGVVDINNTDSISGLGKAFIQAGAKDVVMSLWSVDDNATKELMVSFYKQIKKKPNYALALKEAKLKMIAEDMHPFYWGGFIVLGL